MEMERVVKISLSIILGIFLVASVYYLMPKNDGWMKGYFMPVKPPKECIRTVGFPGFVFVDISSNSYQRHYTYNHSSGMVKAKGIPRNGSYVCIRLVNIVNGTRIFRNETRNISYLEITGMVKE